MTTLCVIPHGKRIGVGATEELDISCVCYDIVFYH